jgi:signal peptidase II
VGGAVSNLFDRVMFDHVRDFIDFTFWWTFNAADLAICAGVIVLIAGIFAEEKERKSIRVTASPQENAPPEPPG